MLRFLIEKEFKQFSRNPFMIRLMVMMPVLLLLILPWAANMEIRNIAVTVVDLDHSSSSRQLIEKLRVSNYFKLYQTADSYDQAMEGISQGKSDLIVVLPERFERRLVRGEKTEVLIAANAVNGTKGGMGSTYLSSILQQFSAKIAMRTVDASALPAQIDVETNFRYNPHLDYKHYMVPALMVVLLTLLCGFLPSLNIVSEKEIGTIEQINVTPVGKFTFILAKLLPYWIMGFVVLTLAIFLAWLIYGFWPVGSLLTLYISSALFVVAMSGFGILVSNSSDTMQQAMFVEFFFIIVFILMSGLFTPINSMPVWAQWITRINPLTYFIEIMRMIYLKGSNLWDIRVPMLTLAFFAVASNVLAVRSYHKQG